MGWLKKLVKAREGSIAVLGALSLVSLIGMSSLAVEVGNGYTAKVRNQRVADVAALGAAMAYNASSSSDKTNVATQTAVDITVANGVNTHPKVDIDPSRSRITVSITTSVPIKLASVLTSSASYNVTSAATASLGNALSIGCVTALGNEGTGVTVTGSSGLNVPGCAVNSNASIQVTGSASISASSISSGASVAISGSASITASTVTAGTGISTTGSSSVHGSQHPNTAFSASDPLADNKALQDALTLVTNPENYIVAPATRAMPSAPIFKDPGAGSDWIFVNSADAYDKLPEMDPVKNNCKYSGSEYTCNSGSYAINNITITGSTKVTFFGPSTISVYGTLNSSGGALKFDGGTGSIFTFRNGFNSGSNGVVFGDGDVYIGGATTLQATSGFGNGNITVAGLLTTGGSSRVKIGDGNHAFGGISVGGSGHLDVGAGDLTVNGAITTAGSTATTFGDGSYVVGKDGNGWSIYHTGNTLKFGNGSFDGQGGIYVNGSSTLTFGTGDMHIGSASSGSCASGQAIYLAGSGNLTLPTGTLDANGCVQTQGSSIIIFGAGTHHNINGDFTINGGATLGAGSYLINGDFYKSASLGATGTNVTIIAAGSFFTGGSASLTLTAPTDASGGGIPGVVFASLTDKDSSIGGSSKNSLGGIFYIPNSNLTISGSGSAGASTCFALIVKTLAVTGGSSANSGCTMPTIESSVGARLIK